jgi:S-adenosylmethionine decarboxylase
MFHDRTGHPLEVTLTELSPRRRPTSASRPDVSAAIHDLGHPRLRPPTGAPRPSSNVSSSRVDPAMVRHHDLQFPMRHGRADVTARAGSVQAVVRHSPPPRAAQLAGVHPRDQRRMQGGELIQTGGLFSGQHVLAELEGVDAALLDNEPFLRETLEHALVSAGATVCDVMSRKFNPNGVTVLALLSESHASVHTYPENGSAFVDVFTCGHRARPDLAVQLIAAAMETSTVRVRSIHRGHDYTASGERAAR